MESAYLSRDMYIHTHTLGHALSAQREGGHWGRRPVGPTDKIAPVEKWGQREAHKRGKEGDRRIEISKQGRDVRPGNGYARKHPDNRVVNVPCALVAPVPVVYMCYATTLN